PTTPRMSYALKMDWEIIDSLWVACMENNLAAFRACRPSYMRALRNKERDGWSGPDPTYNRGF
ncbi:MULTISPECIES: hypothetical protein, partial [unclassified Burkholderia]